jgi:hypothetical protein
MAAQNIETRNRKKKETWGCPDRSSSDIVAIVAARLYTIVRTYDTVDSFSPSLTICHWIYS